MWPEVTRSIKDAGVAYMEIYLAGNRLFMVLEAARRFSLEAKAAADLENPQVQEWERLMWQHQQPPPRPKPGEKWRLAERILKLEA